MRLYINQPGYLPWAGFFGMLSSSDVHVVLDSVQYIKNEWVNRNRICYPNWQEWSYITVPVKYSFGQKINEVEIANKPWAQTHLKTLRSCYSRYPYYDEVIEQLKPLYDQDYIKLFDLIFDIQNTLIRLLGISTKIIKLSDMDIFTKKSKLVADIASELNADVLIMPEGSKVYFDQSCLSSGVEVLWHKFSSPRYESLHKFIPDLSILDVLFSVGTDDTRSLIDQAEENSLFKVI